MKGVRCNECATNAYNLNFNNPRGCAECYCFGISNRCRESDLPVKVVQEEPVHWSVTDLKNKLNLQTHPSEDFPGATREALMDNDEFSPRDKVLYWRAPEEYVGAKVSPLEHLRSTLQRAAFTAELWWFKPFPLSMTVP